MPKIIKPEDFINRALKKHSNKYDYSLMYFQGMNQKIKIICQIHGIFSQSPDVHLRTSGCRQCSYQTRYERTRHTTETFIDKANTIHNNTYDYSSTTYINDSSKLSIVCKTHGTFTQKASSHLQGCGCPKCVGKYRRTTSDFIQEAVEVHDNVYDYSKTEYVNNKTNITIICNNHGMFNQNPIVHLKGGRCPGCRPRQYSLKSIEWLSTISEHNNINIQHAENGGEYLIPNTRMSVDGYCCDNNTIYEFYGDIFHGNPKLFNSDQYHSKLLNKTAGELLERTMKKEQNIKSLGYNLITIWENNWDEYKKINK